MENIKGYSFNLGLDNECQCLFCGKIFKAKEIEFCINRHSIQDGDWYDQIYEEHIRCYKGCDDKEAPYRQWVDWQGAPDKNVLVWEIENVLPAVVEGPLRGDDGNVTKQSGFGFSFFDSKPDEKETNTDTSDKEDTRERFESSNRVCPKCHMTLPEGFMDANIIRIGLIGGPRSGKTTYMTVVCQYLRNRFGDLDNGVEIGDVSFVQECEEYLDHLYEITSRENTGLLPTVIDDSIVKDPPCLPIIMMVTPYAKKPPFYLILQDIPGEYLRSEYKDQLAASNIKLSTDLIMLVDVNHFIKTLQQENNEYGEYCHMEIVKLFDNLRNLGRRLDKQCLKSIQITLTKLDIISEDTDNPFAQYMQSMDGNHVRMISRDRLSKLSKDLESTLQNIKGHDYSKLLDTMWKRLDLHDGMQIEKAYTAIASRSMLDSDNNGMDYSRSVNVLEPILNILAWHKVVPAKKAWYTPYVLQESIQNSFSRLVLLQQMSRNWKRIYNLQLEIALSHGAKQQSLLPVDQT